MKPLSLNFYTSTKIQSTLKIQNTSLQTSPFPLSKLRQAIKTLRRPFFWSYWTKTDNYSLYPCQIKLHNLLKENWNVQVVRLQIICLYEKWIHCKGKAVRCSVRKLALLQRWHCCEILAARTAVQGCAVTSTIVSCFIATE